MAHPRNRRFALLSSAGSCSPLLLVARLSPIVVWCRLLPRVSLVDRAPLLLLPALLPCLLISSSSACSAPCWPTWLECARPPVLLASHAWVGGQGAPLSSSRLGATCRAAQAVAPLLILLPAGTMQGPTCACGLPAARRKVSKPGRTRPIGTSAGRMVAASGEHWEGGSRRWVAMQLCPWGH